MLISPPSASPERSARVAVLASGSGSNFEAICAASGQSKLEVVGLVYNVPGAGVAQRAERLSVPSVLVDHTTFKRRADFDAAVADELARFSPDLIAMAGWMRIATPALLERFPGRFVNIHPSLLPAFIGMDGIGQALRGGVKITGCTVHYVVPEVDAGPIIAQAAVPVEAGDSIESLSRRVHAAEHELYPRALAIAAASLEHE